MVSFEIRKMTFKMNLEELRKSRRAKKLWSDEGFWTLAREICKCLSEAHKDAFVYSVTLKKDPALEFCVQMRGELDHSELSQHFEENLRNGFTGCGNPLFQISDMITEPLVIT
jgi:uncharacterized membrane protein